ncbi:MAG: 60S ribosomal export protein NMD3 [Candidatus Diapherotrites archaeon]|nr:60S ribosomal export protein NMD3 [Candidatus Diapherotrites archaeon]
MKGKFCPKCGATDRPFHGGFCIDCYLKDHPGLAETEDITIKRCTHCLRVKTRGVWESGAPASMGEIVRAHVKTSLESPEVTVELVEPGEKKEVYEVTVKGALGAEPVSLTQLVTVKYEKQTCDVCSRKSGNYYEAILQLRPAGREIDLQRMRSALMFLRNEARAMVKKDRKAEIFRYEMVKNGVDVYFGSARAAKVALQHLQATYRPTVKESYTLKGVDKETGKKRYSVTYSVRL